MKIAINSNLNIAFNEDEIDVLNKSQKILKETSDKLWQSDNDDVLDIGCMFNDVADSINKIINDEY